MYGYNNVLSDTPLWGELGGRRREIERKQKRESEIFISSSEAFQILHYFFVFLKPFPLFSDSSRYSDFAKQLNANGYKVYGMDWSGKYEANSSL